MTPSPTLQDLIESVRADAGTADPLGQLSQAARMVSGIEEVSDAVLGHFVDQCRRSGRSWSEISAALGVSKQAAHKRFSAGAAPSFDRFTPRARAVLGAAAEAARGLGHGVVGPGHLLLALFEPKEALAAQVLAEAGLTRGACEGPVRAAEEEAGSGAAPGPKGELPFSPRTVEVLRGAVEEALLLGHNYIGTEHLLLALYRDPEDGAARVLAGAGAPYDEVRARVVDKLARLTGPTGPTGA